MDTDFVTAERQHHEAVIRPRLAEALAAAGRGSIITARSKSLRVEFKWVDGGWLRGGTDSVTADTILSECVTILGQPVALIVSRNRHGEVYDIANFKESFAVHMDNQLERVIDHISVSEDSKQLRLFSQWCTALAQKFVHSGERRSIPATHRKLFPRAAIAKFTAAWCEALANWLDGRKTEPAREDPAYMAPSWVQASDPYVAFTSAVSNSCVNSATLRVNESRAHIKTGKKTTNLWALPRCRLMCEGDKWDALYQAEDNEREESDSSDEDCTVRVRQVSDGKAADTLAVFMCSRMSNLCDDITGKVRVTSQLADSIITSILESPARVEGGQLAALRVTAKCLLRMADEWGRQGHDIDVIRRAVGIVDRLMGSSRLAAYVNRECIAYLLSDSV